MRTNCTLFLLLYCNGLMILQVTIHNYGVSVRFRIKQKLLTD